MSIFDWLIVIIPLAFVIYMGFYSRKMICQVSDFLSAGRCSRRYLISVAGVAEGLSIISLLGSVEVMYRSGFSMRFWGNTMMPLLIVMGLTGYCTYRFRQTKAMSFGQLLEMRYSRKLRIFAAALRSLSEMLANMIMPALAARFFIYFLGLPHHVNIFGWQMPTFNAIMVFTLSLAVLLVCLGGTLSLMITDCIQGMICYPLMVLFVIFILCNFSWSDHVIPVMMDRIPGESFINPYDVSNIRDFNVFFIGVNFFSAILHRGKYNLDKNISCESAWTWKSIWGKLIGITPEFTVGDKVIAWSIFGYSIVFQFFLAFIGVIIWNIFDPWSDAVWGWYFFIVLLLSPGIIAAVVAVWFGIGIVKDFRIFLSDMKKRKINLLDNGTVEGNMSLADKAELEALDK